MLTKTDIDLIREIVKEEVNGLKSEFSHLPTKDEFYQSMDKVMGELQTIREELTISYGQVSKHEERISDLEKIHPQGEHISP